MMKLRWLALVVFAMVSLAARALPSVEAVQAEVQRGNYVQAESMMRDVVAARPNSARAHYVYAEILAHGRRFDMAAQEVRLARQLDPELKFTQADKFKSFEQLLEREQRAAKAGAAPGLSAPSLSSPSSDTPVVRTAPVAERSGGVPGWVWGAGFAVVAVLLWRMFSGRRPAAASGAGLAAAPSGYAGGAAPGYGPMAGGIGPAAGGGSGMLGTGIAAAGGFAAGMLADRLLNSGGHERDTAAASAASSTRSDGLSPGMFDNGGARGPANEAADDLAQRQVDFGAGDEWGGGSGASSSDSDSGGGGGSDDGW